MNLTPAQLAARWQCSPRTVRRMLEAGLLPHMRISPRVILIAEEDVSEYEDQKLVEKRRGLQAKRRAA